MFAKIAYKKNINMWKTNFSLQHVKLIMGTKLFFRPKTIFANNFNYFGISELEVPGTWKLGTWSSRNLGTWKLRNLVSLRPRTAVSPSLSYPHPYSTGWSASNIHDISQWAGFGGGSLICSFGYTAKIQKAVSAYFTSKQILPFVFAEQYIYPDNRRHLCNVGSMLVTCLLVTWQVFLVRLAATLMHIPFPYLCYSGFQFHKNSDLSQYNNKSRNNFQICRPKYQYRICMQLLTDSSLNLPLSSSSTTSRELLSQFSTYSGWRWFEVSEKLKRIAMYWYTSFHENFRSETLGCRKIKSVFKDVKLCFNASRGFKGSNVHNTWQAVIVCYEIVCYTCLCVGLQAYPVCICISAKAY